MLPKAKELNLDFEALGQKMLDRKKELKQDGIPKDAQHSITPRPGARRFTGFRRKSCSDFMQNDKLPHSKWRI